MDVSALMEIVRDNLPRLVKIKVHNRSPNRTHLTWRFTDRCIYMYDCGESYAAMGALYSHKELLEELSKAIGEQTQQVVLTYSDNHSEFIVA